MFLAGVALGLPLVAQSDDENVLLLQSRQLTAAYATQLQGALQAGRGRAGGIVPRAD